jgi:hypothetical protein
LRAFDSKNLQRRQTTTIRNDIARRTTKKIEYAKPRGKHIVCRGHETATPRLRLIASIVFFGVREGLIEPNPAIGVETTPDKMRTRFLSKEEAARLRKALRTAKDQAFTRRGSRRSICWRCRVTMPRGSHTPDRDTTESRLD